MLTNQKFRMLGLPVAFFMLFLPKV